MIAPYATAVRDLYPVLRPDEALEAGDPRYVDLDNARGRRNVAARLLEGIQGSETRDQQDRALITGHRGCGKTTELHRLTQLLRADGFTVVYWDAQEQFDLNNGHVRSASVLLESLFQIDSALGDQIPLPAAALEDAAEWLARIVTKRTERSDLETAIDAEIGLDSSLPFVGKLKMLFRSLVKHGSSVVREIETEAEQRPTALTNAVADVVAAVNKHLRGAGKKGLVLIADGLEKLPLVKAEDGLTSHSVLFIHQAERLAAPPCHLVYAIPLIALSAEPVETAWSTTPIVMPMVQVYHHGTDRRVNEEAVQALVRLMHRRADPKLFAPGALRAVALASGGHVRDYLMMIRTAAHGEASEVFTEALARRAIFGMMDTYDRKLLAAYFSSLVQVYETQQLAGGEFDGQFFYQLLVLAYGNDRVWYDVHPCIRDTPRFQRHLAEYRSNRAQAKLPNA